MVTEHGPRTWNLELGYCPQRNYVIAYYDNADLIAVIKSADLNDYGVIFQ